MGGTTVRRIQIESRNSAIQSLTLIGLLNPGILLDRFFVVNVVIVYGDVSMTQQSGEDLLIGGDDPNLQ
jgi:hypothetical protein